MTGRAAGAVRPGFTSYLRLRATMDWLNTIIRTFFDFGAMAEVLPQLLGVGLLNTLIISVAATIIGVGLGMVVAVMGISPSKWLRVPARIYTDLFRGLPAILTILLIGQ